MSHRGKDASAEMERRGPQGSVGGQVWPQRRSTGGFQGALERGAAAS